MNIPAKLVVPLLLLVACAPPGRAVSKTDGGAGTVSVDGVDLRYVREGEGPPIVVMGSSTYYARAFSQNLREHFELIFVDARNMLSSYQPTKPELESLTLETQPTDRGSRAL